MRNRTFFTLLALLLVITLSGCGSESEKETRQEQHAAPAADGSVHLKHEQIEANGIRTVEVSEREVQPAMKFIGRVIPRAGGEARVFSPFAGKLVSDSPRLPQVGDRVVKGQLIAEVEEQFVASEKVQLSATAVELQSSIEQAQHEVELKRTERSRAQQLFDGGAIPQKQLQAAEFEVKQAETRLEGARRSKELYDAAQSTRNAGPRRSPITAPITGTVVTANITAGQQIEPSMSLLSITDLSVVWIQAAVHEQDLHRIRGANKAEIHVGNNDRLFNGNLVTVGSTVDAENRTIPVTFSAVNSDATMKIGMFVETRISTGSRTRELVIPAQAVLAEENASSVYVETHPGVYKRRVVVLGDRTGDSIVVSSGLNKGEKVVSTGAQTLRSEALKTQIPAEAEDKKP